jgi:non-specific serine/threonine protein kinase/serine/threonine-protein kinase
MIGPFMVLEKIGKGGGGVVYRAQQKKDVDRLVALKLVTPSVDAPSILARFQHERQMLAKLTHPGIVSFFQAGTAGSKLGNSLYFTMEYVSDQTITAYADSHRLDIEERLEMFLEVCKAVECVHDNGIIHRDIKPLNVLVTEKNGRPLPKLIDFGIAKIIGDDGSRIFATQTGQPVGTPNYMSPEQTDLPGIEVDTRTDIYSLGVVLYELLAGCQPLDMHGQTQEEYTRTIRETIPEPPSSRISNMDGGCSQIAYRRRTDRSKLAKLLQGELDGIVMKCLEKNRDNRHKTADALARDLRKYLEPLNSPNPSGSSTKLQQANKPRALRYGIAAVVLLAAVIWYLKSWPGADQTQGHLRSDLTTAHTVIDRAIHNLDEAEHGKGY